MTKLRWGILGAGKFAGTFAKGIQASQTGELVAIGSRAQESADRFGNEFNVPRRHATYEALVADPEVDVIHISLPNNLHAEWTVKCAQAGKHILCEKPFTVNYPEAVRTLEEVKKYDVFLMEAFMYRCHPQTALLKSLLEEQIIGEVRLIQSNFSYNMGPGYENIRMRGDVAGGGIMDVGCYTASMARLVAGGDPVEVVGVGHIGPISGVDEQATASLKFPNGCVASLACGTQVGIDSTLRVWGSSGSIQVPNPWFPAETGNIIRIQTGEQAALKEVLDDMNATYTAKDGNVIEVSVDGGLPLYAIETDTVARFLAARQAPSPCMTWEDTLGNMKTLDAWRKSIGLIFDQEK